MIHEQNRRPRSLVEVVAWAQDKRAMDAYLREFLDEFYLATTDEARKEMLQPEPALTGDDKVDAYMAAVVEHLGLTYGLPRPAWIENKERFLRRAFFPCGLESLKATLLVQSPVAFRRRMIFVDSNPLYRPRKDSKGIGDVDEGSAAYRFATKCASMSSDGLIAANDISDIEALALQAGIHTAEEALAIVESFYPAKRIPPKVLFGVEEIMERLAAQRAERSPANDAGTAGERP